jgi:hypothetical protein
MHYSTCMVLPKHTITSMHSALTFIAQCIIMNDLHVMGLWVLVMTGKEMFLQIMFVTERLTAQITAIWTLPSMYTLMDLQATCVTERFFTHITAIWTLPSMYTLMDLKLT